MNFESLELTDVLTSGAVNVKFSEGGEQGRTALIIALMLGLGYDFLAENYTPDSICGRSLVGTTYLYLFT
jgi:hypothetical protein